jgi:hypothetical protein
MSKKTVNPKVRHSAPPSHKPEPVKPLPALKPMYLEVGLVVLMLLLVSLLYFPTAFRQEFPPASDISQWQGAANKIIEYNKTHSENALWTQSMFSGMPSYLISFPNRWPFLENISRLTDKVINWRIFLLFIGALGVFLLLRFLKLDIWTSFLGAIAFMFSCHWLGLVEIGHNTKFRAIMYIPWVLWALLYLRRKPGLLGLGFLATMLIVQLRENHPQISYYLYLFIGMYWLWQLIESIKNKDLKPLALFSVLAAVAFGLAVLAVMNPYLSTMEYSHFTMRGGSAGLETSYAQGWSFHPKEILTFIIPDFFGGISPHYWGYMPFTQIYNYFGLVVLGFGVLALFGKKHRRLAVFLWITSFIFTLMSFGSSTPALSDLFMKYLPYFNKFRVPSMILIMVQVNAVLLAALGVDTVLDRGEAVDAKWGRALLRLFWVLGGVFIIWLLLAKSLFGGLPFTTATEMADLENRGLLDQLPAIKDMRLAMLYKSGVLSLLLLVVSIGLAYLRVIKKLPRLAFMLLLTLIVFIDLYVYTGKVLRNVEPVQQHQDRFVAQDYDNFLLADSTNYRIYPIDRSLFSQASLSRPAGEWAYHHQTVMGYSAAKMKRYDDLLKLLQGDPENKLPGEWQRYLIGLFGQQQGSLPRETPTPVLDMLSTKYFIHPEPIPMDSLLTQIRPVFTGSGGVSVYQNLGALPRAWFVDSLRVVTPADSILSLMRSESFDPRHLAYVETELKNVQKPDSAWVKQTKAGMHDLAYDLYTDKPAFLVLSEVYYPAGWKALLDGKEIPIQPANYILRGLQIPAGQHKLELSFAPASYKRSVALSLIGLLLSLLALAGGLAWRHLKQKNGTLQSG